MLISSLNPLQRRRRNSHGFAISGLGRSPGVGNGEPLQYSFLENSMDSGAWQDTVHGPRELDTTERLSSAQKEKH